MAELERTIHGLTVRVDRSVCAGFGQCMDEAPDAFTLGDDDLVTFKAPENASRDALVAAVGTCPVEALSAFNEKGDRVAP